MQPNPADNKCRIRFVSMNSAVIAALTVAFISLSGDLYFAIEFILYFASPLFRAAPAILWRYYPRIAGSRSWLAPIGSYFEGMLLISAIVTASIFVILLIGDFGLESHEKDGAIIAIPVGVTLAGGIAMVLIIATNMIFSKFLFPGEDTPRTGP